MVTMGVWVVKALVAFTVSGSGMFCATLPQGYSIETSNSDPDHFYLISQDGLIAHGEDLDSLFLLAWREYRQGKGDA